MKVPSADFNITNSLMNKVNDLTQPEQHVLKRHVVSRVICAVATTAFKALDAAYNLISAAVKLPFAIVKGTIGRIDLPKIGKLNDQMPKELGMKEVSRHAAKALIFAATALVSPFVGGILNPRWDIAMNEKLGIMKREEDTVEEPAVTVAPIETPTPEKEEVTEVDNGLVIEDVEEDDGSVTAEESEEEVTVSAEEPAELFTAEELEQAAVDLRIADQEHVSLEEQVKEQSTLARGLNSMLFDPAAYVGGKINNVSSTLRNVLSFNNS